MSNPIVFVPPDVYQILSDDPVCERFRASLDVILEIAPGCDAVIDPQNRVIHECQDTSINSFVARFRVNIYIILVFQMEKKIEQFSQDHKV